jgi:SAM-dependent methyltransferase
MPALAQTGMPGKFRSFCERILIDRGWLKAETRAQIHPVSGRTMRIDNVVVVDLDGSNSPTRFARTRRSVTDIVQIDHDFPYEFFALENLKGKKVLDLACGEGRAVEQLLRAGVDVVGLDIHLTPYMLSKPYFIKASAHETGLPSESFDVIYSVQGPFTYLVNQQDMMEALMKEAHRLLKKGGVLRLSSVIGYGDYKDHGARPEIDLRDTVYTNLPKGMRIKSYPDRWWFITNDPGEGGHQARYWLELERTD